LQQQEDGKKSTKYKRTAALTYDTWVQIQNDYNDERIEQGKIVYPTWYVTGHKRIRMEHNFKDGETFICFQKIPDDKNYKNIQELKLDVDDWTRFRGQEMGKIQVFLTYLESTALSVDEKQKKIKELLAGPNQENRIREDYRNCNQSVCMFPLNGKFMISLLWDPAEKSCFIALRQGSLRTSIDGEFRYWKGDSEAGICFNGNSFKYFSYFLADKITNGLRMWKEMQYASAHMWISLFSKYVPCLNKGGISYKRMIPIEDQEEREELVNAVSNVPNLSDDDEDANKENIDGNILYDRRCHPETQ
jgi:hypothetical protein